MAIEIERKFLVKNETWKSQAKPQYFKQGYLWNEPSKTVRVRIVEEKGFLTIKLDKTALSRLEFEYEIPLEDAQKLLDSLGDTPLIEKYRYKIDFEGFWWEIDEFLGENKGLIVAEIELETENQTFTIPEWIGVEVTHDSRYFNASLVQNPFKNW